MVLVCAALLIAVAACARAPSGGNARSAAATPAQAVRQLTMHLRDGDLAAFARAAVPPPLHARLDTAWRAGTTRWPLDALPLSAQLPQAMATLAAADAEKTLQRSFDRQFAGAAGELKNTATTLGLFGVQYVRNEADFSAEERAHYAQLVTAVSGWAQAAPLSDRDRARATIATLTAAARRTGLTSDADFARAGIDASLRRLQPFVIAFKQALVGYGLDVDTGLGGLDATLQSQTGDNARVRMRYRIGDTAIDTVVAVERIGGRWYVSDHLRAAEAAAARTAAPNQLPATASPSPSPPTTPAAPQASRAGR
ncbi:MAG: hypothetical protein ACREO8_03650 [Luteimonas sp.]